MVLLHEGQNKGSGGLEEERVEGSSVQDPNSELKLRWS